MRKIIVIAFFILIVSASMVSAMQPVIVPGQNIHTFGSRTAVTNELDVYNWTSAFQNFKLIEQWEASAEVWFSAVTDLLVDMGNDIDTLKADAIAIYNNLATMEAELGVIYEAPFTTGTSGNAFNLSAYQPAYYDYFITLYTTATTPLSSYVLYSSHIVAVTIPSQTVNITDSGGDTASVVIPQQTVNVTIPQQQLNLNGNIFAVQRVYHNGTNLYVDFTCPAPYDGTIQVLIKKK